MVSYPENSLGKSKMNFNICHGPKTVSIQKLKKVNLKIHYFIQLLQSRDEAWSETDNNPFFTDHKSLLKQTKLSH